MPGKDSDRVTKKKMRLFLRKLAKTGALHKAAKSSGLSVRRMRRLRAKDEKFSHKIDDALEAYVGVLEDEADRRGIKGVAEPVFYEGEVCGHKQKYSDGLLQFRLKALAPEKYRERTDVKTEGGDTHITVYLPENGRPNAPGAKP